jgi:hypothetical protein
MHRLEVYVKHKISVLIAFLSLAACAGNPNKAEKIETKMENAEAVSGTQAVGVKNGEMVVMDKAEMSEKLRDLQNAVYSLEDKVYGTRKLGSLGLYGDLKACKRKQASRQFGGTGTMVWTEPLDRVTDKEEELKVGVDEKKNLVGVSEEFLKDRVARFQRYKQILQKRSDEFEEKISSCKNDLATKEIDSSQTSRVMVSEAPKASIDRQEINLFLCSFVKPGASLQAFMLNAFSKGWLSLSDYKLEQNLIGASLKDSKGTSKDNAMLFNGWKLAFDHSPVTVGELLNEGKDARLVAWSFDHKADVPASGKCLSSSDGVWNQ